MSNDDKTALLTFSLAIGVFYFFIRPRIKAKNDAKKTGKGGTIGADGSQDEDVADRKPITAPTINPAELKNTTVRNAYNAMKAYIKAYNAGETESSLKIMVLDMRSNMGVKVYRKPDGRVAVSDTLGKDIIVNNEK